ncbi:MAG: hypothetical protein Q8J78_15400 [Moraxellaceae bacterium]|nr:hypothetical protein [Moraxellaceae bacterium]
MKKQGASFPKVSVHLSVSGETLLSVSNVQESLVAGLTVISGTHSEFAWACFFSLNRGLKKPGWAFSASCEAPFSARMTGALRGISPKKVSFSTAASRIRR